MLSHPGGKSDALRYCCVIPLPFSHQSFDLMKRFIIVSVSPRRRDAFLLSSVSENTHHHHSRNQMTMLKKTSWKRRRLLQGSDSQRRKTLTSGVNLGDKNSAGTTSIQPSSAYGEFQQSSTYQYYHPHNYYRNISSPTNTLYIYIKISLITTPVLILDKRDIRKYE